MKRTLSLTLSLLLLCGCTAPTAWLNPPTDTPSPTPTEPPVAEGALPRDQALEESRNLELADQGRFTFAPGLTIECPDMVYQGQVMQMAEYSDEVADTLLHWWVPDEVWNDAYLTLEEDQLNLYPLGSTYEEENVWYADVWCTGSAYYLRDEGWDLSIRRYRFDYVDTYEVLLSGTSMTDAYPVSDGTLTIAQVVQMGNDFAAEWCALIPDYPMELRVKTIEVYDRGDGTYFFDLQYESSFEGVPVTNDPSTSLYEHVAFSPVIGLIASTEGLCQFGSGGGAVVPYDMSTCSKLLPLEQAVERMMEGLPDNTNYEVRRIALEYRFTDDGSAQTPDQYRIPNAYGTLVPDSTCLMEGYSYQLYQLHPYWVFYVHASSSKDGICYYNCLTGEFEIQWIFPTIHTKIQSF